MNRVIVTSRVDPDGVLRVTLPFEAKDADREVQVTVDPVSPKKEMPQAEWAAWVDSMGGSWQGDFERPSQGDFEVRGSLS